MSAIQKSAAPRVVLLVEDDRLTANAMRQILERAGYDARVASTGSEGLEAARHMQPVAVICDIGLPEMTGWDLARALRRDSITDRACMIALSGYGLEDDQPRSMEAGFDLHLVKPVDPEELCRILAQATKPN